MNDIAIPLPIIIQPHEENKRIFRILNPGGMREIFYQDLNFDGPFYPIQREDKKYRGFKVIALGNFISVFHLEGTWAMRTQGFFKNVIDKSNYKFNIPTKGPIFQFMKAIDIIIAKECRNCDTIAYLDTRIDQLMYVIGNQINKKNLGYLVLYRTDNILA